MNTPLVSIIIPTYNRAHLISETLDSVLLQTYTNWECIIVDDGSSDDTDKILAKYANNDARFRFLKRDKKKIKGASACRNTGLDVSKGEYCLFLDSDDWLLNHCLSQRVFLFQNNQNIDFMVVSMKTKKEGELPVDKIIPESKDYLIDFLSYKLYWQTMCTLWKREFLLKLDGFNEKYPRLNDPEIHIRGMLKSQNNFYIARELPADSIYRTEEVKKGEIFSSKYSESLAFFFKDISNALKKNGCKKEVIYLQSYLLSYLIHFSYCMPLRIDIKLISLCRIYKIINNKQFFGLSLRAFIRKTNFKISNYINSK